MKHLDSNLWFHGQGYGLFLSSRKFLGMLTAAALATILAAAAGASVIAAQHTESVPHCHEDEEQDDEGWDIHCDKRMIGQRIRAESDEPRKR